MTEANPNRTWWGIVALIVVAILFWWRLGDRSTTTSASSVSYQSYWNSGQPSLMREVINAAIDGDRVAEATIVGHALKGSDHDLVRGKLIRVAFNPKWEGELSSEDRGAALMLACLRLLPPERVKLPPLARLHGAVILALVGDLGFDDSKASLSQLPLNALTKLPAPYGFSFQELQRLGIDNMDAKPARALARIASGEVRDDILWVFFDGSSDDAVRTARLRVLVPLMGELARLPEVTYATLVRLPGVLKELMAWFELERIASWEKVELAKRLGLAAGLKVEGLTFQQRADLLSYPSPAVRDGARKSLEQELGSNTIGPVLTFLINNENKLTRSQVVSLLTLLGQKDNHDLVTTWFNGEPEARSVLRILMLRVFADSSDAFNLEAARYISRNKLQLEPAEYEELAAHPEPLARAIAYTHLRTDDPKELEILKAALKRESNEKLKQELMRRIADEEEFQE